MIVPFPISRRWTEEQLVQAKGLNVREMSGRFTRAMRTRKKMLRAIGVAEVLVQADIAPVRKIFFDALKVEISKGKGKYQLELDVEDVKRWKHG